VAARVVHPRDQITIITSNGIMLRTTVAEISQMGRSTRGVRIVKLGAGDSVAALAVIGHEDLDRKVEGSEDAVGTPTEELAEIEEMTDEPNEEMVTEEVEEVV